MSMLKNKSEMRIKVAGICLIFCIYSCSSNSDQSPSPSNAPIETAVSDAEMKEIYTWISENHYAEAAEITQGLLGVESNSDNALLLYYHGFAHKGLFNETRDDKSRSVAISSFKKVMESDSTDQLSEQAFPILNYLSTSLYNDASNIIVEADPKTINLAEQYFSKHKYLAVYLNPEIDFTQKEIGFLLAMSTAFRKISEKSESNGEHFKSKQEDYLNNVLKLDPKNESAQYSLDVFHHNERLRNLE